jgi:hypothetical protein
MSSSKDWRRQLVRRFKRWADDRFPVPYPLRYYLRPQSMLPGFHGYFLFNDEEVRGVIVIAENATREVMIDTLCEELAHARTAHLCTEDEDPHTPSFWAEYGRIVMACREYTW